MPFSSFFGSAICLGKFGLRIKFHYNSSFSYSLLKVGSEFSALVMRLSKTVSPFKHFILLASATLNSFVANGCTSWLHVWQLSVALANPVAILMKSLGREAFTPFRVPFGWLTVFHVNGIIQKGRWRL